nr:MULTISPECIES: EAL domain-containing protein [Erwiniaceae]
MAALTRKRNRSWLLLLAAGLLPVLLSLVFTFIEAKKIVRHQQVSTTETLLNQAEEIANKAWDMLDRLQQYDRRECAPIEKDIHRLGSIYAYFRSVGLSKGDNVLCSSAYGQHPGTLQQMVRLPQFLKDKKDQMLSIDGTVGAPDRPAVIFYRALPSGYGVFAVVDGQYLTDLMRVLGISRGYQMEMQFGGGFRIQTGQVNAVHNSLADNSRYSANSSRYPISISVTSPATAFVKSWQQIFLTFLPMTVMFSLLFMALVRSWLKRKMSFRYDIRKAIENQEFTVHYQPVYHAKAGSCSGVEALMRWRRRDGKWVRPDIFIAAAEAETMIVPLTRHLLDLIARDVAHWSMKPGFHLGVNVAAEHLQHSDFVSDIRQFVQKLADKQVKITLELTERSLITDGEGVAKKLALLRREGLAIAIDDFGTGHCSLKYLQQFELDYLKIDRGFINSIESIESETPVLDAIISLGDKLALQVLGEGVETQMQLEYLLNHGVTFIQGYYYARAMDSNTLQHWLQHEGKKSIRDR